MHKTETTKSLLQFNWVLPFPKSLFTKNHSVHGITSSVSAHLGGSQNPSQSEVQEVLWKGSHLGQAQGSLPGVPRHTPSVGNQALYGSARPKFSSPAKCQTACNIYPVQIAIIKVSFLLLPESPHCISWVGFAAALGLSFTPMESAPNQEPCFAQI